MKSNEKKLDFSKMIFVTVLIMVSIVFINAFALMWITKNLDSLDTLIVSASGFFSISIGFYYWKARLENSIKLSREFNVTHEELGSVLENIRSDG